MKNQTYTQSYHLNLEKGVIVMNLMQVTNTNQECTNF